MADLELKNSLQSIIHKMDSIGLDSLNEDELLHIAKLVKVDELKEELSGKIRQFKFNREERLNHFLQITSTSKETRRKYKAGLNHYFAFLDREGIHVLEVRAHEANRYILSLGAENRGGASCLIFLRAVSSFYSFLVDLEDIRHNFFKGRKHPWDDVSGDPRVPTSYEVEYIKLAFEADGGATGTGSVNKRKSARLLLILIELAENTGLRVGALKSLKVKADCSYTGYSKGKKITGYIPRDMYEKIREAKINFSVLNTGTLQNAFSRKMLELFGEYRFSWHSLRHYFAVTFYNQTHDIVRLARLLHHSSTTITENYLKSLKVYDNKYHNRAE